MNPEPRGNPDLTPIRGNAPHLTPNPEAPIPRGRGVGVGVLFQLTGFSVAEEIDRFLLSREIVMTDADYASFAGAFPEDLSAQRFVLAEYLAREYRLAEDSETTLRLSEIIQSATNPFLGS